MLANIYNIEAPAPGRMERKHYGTAQTGYYPATMELSRRNRRMKHYRATEMTPPPWGPTRVDLSASSNLWVITGPSGSGKSRVGMHLCAALGLIFIEGDDFLTQSDKDYMKTNGVLDDDRHTEVLAAIIDAAIMEAGNGTGDVVVACSALRVDDRDAWRAAVTLANTGAIPAQGLQSYPPSYENHTLPNLQGNFHPPQGTQDPYHQDDPYHQTITHHDHTYHSPPSSTVTTTAATTFRHIHLQFIYLAISPEASQQAVGRRRRRSNHFMLEDAVPAQFNALQPPMEWETDCYEQASLERAELKAAVERYVVWMTSNGRCMCMSCNRS